MNSIKNLLKFIKAIFSLKDINWYYIGAVKQHCTIAGGVKTYTPTHLLNVTIETGTYIAENAWISFTHIGKFCSIGPNLVCGRGIHPVNGISTSPMFYSTMKQNGMTLSSRDKIEERKQITIGNDVFIGANVTILDGVTIENGAVIGAGSLVNKNVPAYAVMGGVPARLIRYRFTKEQIDSFLRIQWWSWPADKLKIVETNIFQVEEFLKEFDQSISAET